jgi:hypothetical protein
VLKRGLRNLEGAEESFPELDLAKLRLSLAVWLDYLAAQCNAPKAQRSSGATGRHAASLPAPELPQITLRSEHCH